MQGRPGYRLDWPPGPSTYHRNPQCPSVWPHWLEKCKKGWMMKGDDKPLGIRVSRFQTLNQTASLTSTASRFSQPRSVSLSCCNCRACFSRLPCSRRSKPGRKDGVASLAYMSNWMPKTSLYDPHRLIMLCHGGDHSVISSDGYGVKIMVPMTHRLKWSCLSCLVSCLVPKWSTPNS